MLKLTSNIKTDFGRELLQAPFISKIIGSQDTSLAIADLDSLMAPGGGLFASTGPNYHGMIFGRDSLEVADDLLGARPGLALNVIDLLAYFQGSSEDNNKKSGVQTGKIMHQHGQLEYRNLRVGHETELLINKLSELWGGDDTGFTNYDSLDSTPLFIRLVSRYGLKYGPDFLNEEIAHESGKTRTRQHYLDESLKWLVKHLYLSSVGFLEFRREHKDSIIIQNWRDSGSSMVHIDGSQANINEYIAPLDVQGYAYDALVMSARLFEKYQLASKAEVHRIRTAASTLRENLFSSFWMEETQSFAMALDRDENHNPRLIKTPSSSQGALLDTRLFSDLDDQLRVKYVGGIVKSVYNSSFITDVGIRCRSKEYAYLTGFADYHGSWAVWAKESYDFAKGLRRQGFRNLSRDMANRIINSVNVSGANYELWYVNPLNGEVDYHPKRLKLGDEVNQQNIIPATNIPEEGQAWTVSAVIAIKNDEKPGNIHSKSRWSRKLEAEILKDVGKCRLLKSKREIEKFRLGLPEFYIDIEQGMEFDKKWNPEWWG
jgi:glycogen debranching enzyme